MDGSGPPRANAAQMAQRQIKAMKGGRSANRPRAGPVQSPSPAFGQSQSAPSAQPFQFQPPNGSAGGGGFNFSFGGGGSVNNPFATNGGGQPLSANDERRDPREERESKRRSSNGGLDGSSVPLFAPMPQNTPNIFGASQSTNGLSQNGGLFSSSNGFNSGMSVDQPQSTTSTPPTSFGSFGQSQSTSNPFNTGQPSSQPSGTFNFNFGASTQPTQPASTPFAFGQSPAPSKGVGFQFGATPATEAPATNLFGTSQPPSTNLFGTTSQTPSSNSFSSAFGQRGSSPAPATNLFGSTTQPTSTSLFTSSTPASTNPFGSREASPAPPTNTPNLFGTSTQPPTSNLFSNTSSTSSDIFGKKSDATPAPSTPSQKLFGSTQQAQPSNLSSIATPSGQNPFPGKAATSALPASGSQTTAEGQSKPFTASLFGQQAQQQTDGTTKSTLFAGLNPSPMASGSPFTEKKTEQTNNLFANLGKSSPVFDSPKKIQEQSGSATSIFTPKQQNTADLFGTLNQPVDQAVTDPKPATPSLFGSSTPQQTPSSLFGQEKQQNAPFSFGSAVTPKPTTEAASSNITTEASQQSKPLFSFGTPQAAPLPPAPQPSKATLFSPLKPSEPSLVSKDATSLGLSSTSQSAAQPKLQPLPGGSSIEKTSDGELIGDALRRLTDSDPHQAPKHDGTDLRDLNVAGQISDEYLAGIVPNGFTETQKKDFYCAYRIRALNRGMAVYFGGLLSAGDPTAAMKFYLTQRNAIMASVKTRNGRPLLVEKGGRIGTASSEIQKITEASKPVSPTRQATSSPVKPQPTLNGVTPRVNGTTTPLGATGSLTPASTSLLPQISTAAPSTGGKRKAEDNLHKDNADEINKRPMRKIATPSQSRTNESSSSGSTTSNIFRTILDSPSKAGEKSPVKKTASLPGSSAEPTSESPKVNPFGSLFVPKSPTKTNVSSSPKKQDEPSQTSTGFTPSSSATFGFKPTEPAKTTGFVPTPSNPSSSSAASGGFKMPGATVGGTMNFTVQFGSDTNDSDEAKALKEAIDKDFDSEEEDLEVFKTKWKKARRERIEKYATAASTSKSTFSFTSGNSTDASKAGKPLFGFNPTTQPKAADPVKSVESAAPSKPLFSFGASTSSPNNGFLSPANISRASTASPAPSSSGSVLDGHAPGKPVTFGNNIFGHLSGGDSGKSDDADDENGDDGETDSDPEIDADSENKDPNYMPGQDSGPNTPGTPVEETGAGIASAKKSNLFNFPPSKSGSIFGGSPSGTSTPGGSLFGRITRDTSAKPVTASSEEKENTQPSGTSIFAALNKNQSSPVDQTWKIDSPIKFGSATPNNDSKTPTVNVTSATPTKSSNTTGLFSNLNSSSGPTSAPFSNLFGSSTTPKPAATSNLGFNFGGASNASSLFPSANTSRATTPGATTDGDSAAEDPDAEKHEQISLTSGGAGEEDEDVQFEVRVKAQLFAQKDGGPGAWEVKGLGPLRILKHKETKATRVLLRAEPRGNLVLNKSILGKVKYEASGKTVKFVAANESGKGLETWLLQVKTVDSAKELAEALETNKTD